MARLATIGVYGWDLERFLGALGDADIRRVIDVRQRRGVRGPEYAWANSQRLQRALREAGIAYEHRKDLAPTTELRQLQYVEDARLGKGKRNRDVLAEVYIEGYEREILSGADLGSLCDELPAEGGAALLCVERDPEACHRSLVAAAIGARGVTVEHLRP